MLKYIWGVPITIDVDIIDFSEARSNCVDIDTCEPPLTDNVPIVKRSNWTANAENNVGVRLLFLMFTEAPPFNVRTGLKVRPPQKQKDVKL